MLATQLRWSFAARCTAALVIAAVSFSPGLASTDGAWRTPTPIFAHTHSAAIYDPIRYRVVSFGGIGSVFLNSVSELRLSGDGTWTDIPASGPGPVARAYASAIYDSRRDRMVVFGGMTQGTEYLNDVWELSLDNSTWNRIVPLGQPPDPRLAHSAIYDSTGDRMIVFGGYEAGVPVSDVWALSFAYPPTWTRIDAGPHAPLPRYFHSAIYDHARNRMVVFGGWTGGSGPIFRDVWALSLGDMTQWTRLDTLLPAPWSQGPYRWDHSAVYDPAKDRMIVFGGGEDITYRNDVWSYSFSGTVGWQQWILGSSPPPARHGHTAVLDPVADRMIVTGGEGDYTGPFSDAWSLSLSDTPVWEQLSPPPTGPPPRYGHAAVYDPTHSQMLVFGGQGPLVTNDTWALSLHGDPQWSIAEGGGGTAAPTTVYHPAIFDPVRDRMILDEGYDGAWALPLDSSSVWSHLVSGESPDQWAWEACAIYDPVRDRMVVFGGGDEFTGRPTNAIWSFDLSGAPSWTQLSAAGTQPPPLEYTSAIYDSRRDRMLLYAGTDGNATYGDVWALSFSPTLTWELLAPSGPLPLARYGHTAVYDSLRDRMVVFGGVSQAMSNEVWALSLSDPPTWSLLNPAGPAPGARWVHSSVYSPENDYMVVFGGEGGGGSGPLGDLWLLDWTDRAGILALGAGLSPNGVHLLWQGTSLGTSTPELHRQQDGGPWVALGNLSPESDGRIMYTDTAIKPGVQYNYGLSLDSLDAQSFMGEISVRVPYSPPTPALLSLIDAHADSGFVVLQWYAADPSIFSYALERRTAEGAWETVTQLSPGGDRILRYEDRSVLAGARYGYRVVFQSGGRSLYSAEVWVTVPFQSSFTLRAIQPNPTVGALTVSFSLKDFVPARLEILDVTGRIRVSRELAAHAPGDYTLPVAESATLPIGLYVVRLTQGSQVATRKVCLVR